MAGREPTALHKAKAVPHWKLTSADKEKLEGVILTTATLGMIAVVVVRFYTLFAPAIAL